MLEQSLFGFPYSIDHTTAFTSFLIIIGVLLFLEWLIEQLNKLTHDTSFEEIVLAIQRELMIVGCMAFSFKILLNIDSVNVNDSWAIALEFADLVVEYILLFFFQVSLSLSTLTLLS